MPEISVIVPCYGQAKFLSESLDSVMAQTFKNWECVIVNDHSTDDTETIANEICEKDSRIKLVTTDRNLGLAGARNFGIAHASGTYILPLDADDKIDSRYCEEAIKAFEKNREARIVYCKAELFGNNTGPWNLPPYHFGLLFGRNPLFCSSFFRKMDWEAVNGYNEELASGLEDWDFWLKLLKKDSIVIRLPFTGFFYRQHDQSMIKDLTANESLYRHQLKQMFLTHFDKWRDWAANHLYQSIQAYEIQKERESAIRRSPAARFFYSLARLSSKQ
jgi:glycosyltransferase involved in cell wall biosynthesis